MPELIDRHKLLQRVYEHPYERAGMTDAEWCRKCIYCLENPRGGGAWWAAVYGAAQSRTRLKRLSSSY